MENRKKWLENKIKENEKFIEIAGCRFRSILDNERPEGRSLMELSRQAQIALDENINFEKELKELDGKQDEKSSDVYQA